MDYIYQIIIVILTTSLGAVLSFFASTKKSKDELEKVKLSTENEIKKIKEESEKEISKIKIQTKELIKLETARSEISKNNKNTDMQNELAMKFMGGFLENPESATKQLTALMNLSDKINPKK